MIDERIFDWRRMMDPGKHECPDYVETADEAMDTPEVDQVFHRLRRIGVMKDMGCPPRVMQTEYRLLWQEEVAAGRRVVS